MSLEEATVHVTEAAALELLLFAESKAVTKAAN